MVGRMMGLLNHARLGRDCGLLLWNTKSIHTKGMNFSISLVALDERLRVISVMEEVKPGCRMVCLPNRTQHVLEVDAEAMLDAIKVGDQFVTVEVPRYVHR